MAIPFHKELTNLDGLRKTILNDKYAYRWFLHLFRHSNFQPNTGNFNEFKQDCAHLHKLSTIMFAYNLVLMLSLIFTLWIKAAPVLIFSSLFVFLLFKTHKIKKQAVTEMTMRLIKQDYTEDQIKQTTLYQIGEFYSEKYKIISLVDAIYHLDKIYRGTLIITFILCCYIVLMNQWWHQYLAMLILYLIVEFIVNTPLFYKRLE